MMRLPTRSALGLYLKLYVGLHLLFVLVYGGANWLAARHARPFHYYAEWERDLPFVPVMIYAYFSIALLFWMPLFMLDEARLRRLGMAAAACMLLAAAIFVMAPGTTAFTPRFAQGGTLEAVLFRLLHSVDRPFNTAPSLHVALSTLLVLVAREGTPVQWLRALLLCWLGAIVLSVLLVHQHHLVDVLTGALLGIACHAWYRPRRPRAGGHDALEV